MAGVELFSIPASNPTIHTFREQQELREIVIRSTWLDSKTLHAVVPLSKVNQDPWGEKASISAQCCDGHPLEIQDQGGDVFTIPLPNISDVHLKVGTAGQFRDFEIKKPFSIDRGEDDPRGNPTFLLSDHEESTYELKIFNQTQGEQITGWPIRRSSDITTILLLTRAHWLAIEETSTLTLEISRENEEEPFHVETVTVEPAPITEYTPSIERETGRFSGGRQTMEVHVSGLHSSQRKSTAEFNWDGESATKVDINNGVFTLPVPLKKSGTQGFLVIPEQKARLVIEPYSTRSEDTCTLEQTRESVVFSSAQAEEPFLTVKQTGDWLGNLCVELARRDNQQTANDVLMSESIPLSSNGQAIDLNLVWLLERIPNIKSHVLATSLDVAFELNFHVFCGEDEEDRSESISTQLLQPESIIQINEVLNFDEGREEPESIVFTYDQFYIEAEDEFTLEVPGRSFTGTAREGEIEFEMFHPSIDQMNENSVWKLIKHGQEMLSGSYLVWPVEVHPPEKEATILVDPEFSSISYPDSLFILQSLPLPSKCDMQLHLQIGSNKPGSTVCPFVRGSSGESADVKQSVSMVQFFGNNSELRNQTWLKKCKESGPGKIGEYWVELPTRNQGEKRKFPLYVEIDIDAAYLAALRYLKHQAASIDVESVSQFFDMDLEHREVVEDIIFTVLGHVYHDTERKEGSFREAVVYFAGESGFHNHTKGFRVRMKEPFSFFFDLFGKEVMTGSAEGLKFMQDASMYFDRSTNKSKDDLERLWGFVKNE
jgi:hypothetical protein